MSADAAWSAGIAGAWLLGLWVIDRIGRRWHP